MRSIVIVMVIFVICIANADVGWHIAPDDATKWRMMPTWLGNPSSRASVERVRVDGIDALRFTIPEPRKGMKWVINARWVNIGRYRYLCIRYLARGFNTNSEDYFVYINDGIRHRGQPFSLGLTVLHLSQVKSDGKWHWLVADLQALDVAPYLTIIALQVQAMDEPATLLISEFAFVDELPEGATLPKPPQPKLPHRKLKMTRNILEGLQARPTWLANPCDGARVDWDGDAMRFHVPEGGKGMKWAVQLDEPLNLRGMRYVVIDYRATGVRSCANYLLYIAPRKVTKPESEYYVARLDDIIPDGKWRRIVGACPSEEACTIAFQVQAMRGGAVLWIRSVRFTSHPPEHDLRIEDLLPPEPKQLLDDSDAVMLDIAHRYNASLRQLLHTEPVRSWQFANERITVAGVPFRVATGERNVIITRDEIGAVELPIANILARGRSARNSKVTSEVYLLVAASFPKREEPSYAVGRLWRIRHPHRCAVELVYGDGESERVFPCRVSSRTHEVVSGLDVYVVPVARGKALKAVVFHDRMRLGDFGICAVTLNVGAPRMTDVKWQLDRRTVTATMSPLRGDVNPSVRVGDEALRSPQRRRMLILECAGLKATFDISRGITWRELRIGKRDVLANRTPLFEVQCDGVRVTSADYTVQRCITDGNATRIELLPPKPNLPILHITMLITDTDALDGARDARIKRLRRCAEFLRSLFTPQTGLLREHPTANTCWLSNDNVLAASALRGFDAKLASQIELAVRKFDMLPSRRIRALLGDTDVEVPPFSAPRFVSVAKRNGVMIKTETDAGVEIHNWQEYADLVLIAALNAKVRGDTARAHELLNRALAMWDGIGLRDSATLATKRYAVYKLALLLWVASELGRKVQFATEVERRIWAMQASNGGITTDYDADGKPIGTQNAETTSIVMLALSQMRGFPAIEFRATARNATDAPMRPRIAFPAMIPIRIGARDVYVYPSNCAVISDAGINFRWRYGGSFPLQFLCVTNPEVGLGACIMTKDLVGYERWYCLQRRGEITRVGIDWRTDPIEPNGAFEIPAVELSAHGGDWHDAFNRYIAWTRTWYEPLAPRKKWFRRVFAFRQDYIRTGLYDFEHSVYKFRERVELARKAFGACDYLHIFDWGATRMRGRVGDYDPWSDVIPGPDEFKRAVQKLKGNGVPVGLYIEGYLVDKRSRIGRMHMNDWGLRNSNGDVQLWSPGSSEFVMCPKVRGWQDYLTHTYVRVQRETGAMGFYIDEFGFAHRNCFARNHGHPVGWQVLRGERELVRSVRSALPLECAVYTEETPVDITIPLQDGSFTYSVNSFQHSLYQWTHAPVKLARFAFTDFKTFEIIVCDRPTGSNEEAVKQVFFNGEGYWLQGEPDVWFTPETLATIRKCIGALVTYRDVFACDQCAPFVETQIGGLFANRFGPTIVGGRCITIWVLYNANPRTVRGVAIRVPHFKGARYFDAFTRKPLKVIIQNAIAEIAIAVDPHDIACIVQVR